MALFWKIIYWSGYFPRFRHCSYCNKKLKEADQYYFILSQGIDCGCQSRKKIFWDNEKNNLKINLTKNVIKLIFSLTNQEMKNIQKMVFV